MSAEAIALFRDREQKVLNQLRGLLMSVELDGDRIIGLCLAWNELVTMRKQLEGDLQRRSELVMLAERSKEDFDA